jgi:hypothetical protein
MPFSGFRKAIAFAMFVTILCLPAARADGLAPPPPAQRAATATMVVIGKVVSLEDKSITAKRYPEDPEKGEYTIAIVKIDSAVVGAKGLTHIRVGFIPRLSDPNIKYRRPAPVQLKKDDEVILFLDPHFEANFHVAPNFYDGIFNTKGSDFEKMTAEIKQVGKLLNDPIASLTSKEVKDREMTAMLLIARYRSRNFAMPNQKQEPVDAKESKLILEALAGADWGNVQQRVDRLSPVAAFGMLGLTDKDGWYVPADLEKFPAAAKLWLTNNAEKYRIQRFVNDKPEKSGK